MSKPIYACATAPFTGAIAIVRVSGPDLGSALNPLLKLPPARQAALKMLQWKGFQERALVIFFPGPRSYTGEDMVEFQLHGNPLLVKRFMEELGRLGIALAEPGEFTKRALFNGKQNLLEAEALRDMVAAATDAQLRMAQNRGGGLPAWVSDTRSRLEPWIARIEASVDYGEEEGIDFPHQALRRDLEGLRERFHVEQSRSDAARWLEGGIRIALVGRPNAGKSTLFNALAGEDRAIVTEIPGTTRDVLEVRCEWSGLPLFLFDTAGIRDSQDPIERLGVARVSAVLEKVDLILHLIPLQDDAPDPAILERLQPYAWKVMDVRTFADQSEGPDTSIENLITVSGTQGNLESLAAALKKRFLGDYSPEACLGALATQRQRELLSEMALQLEMLFQLPEGSPLEVPASILQGLWGLLMKLTGEDRAESTLDQVFSGFCLGK